MGCFQNSLMLDRTTNPPDCKQTWMNNTFIAHYTINSVVEMHTNPCAQAGGPTNTHAPAQGRLAVKQDGDGGADGMINYRVHIVFTLQRFATHK